MRLVAWSEALLLVIVAVGCARGQGGGLDGASWTQAASGPRAGGVRLLEGADGFSTAIVKGNQPCVANKPGTQPPSTYLYFAVDAARKRALRGPVFLIVEFYDDTLGGMVTTEYDSATGDAQADKYRHAEGRAGGFTLGLKKWRKAYFELRKPRFAGRQNCGADFRLSGTRLYIKRVSLTTKRPADWAKVNTMPNVRIQPKVKIGAGGQLIVGGFDPAKASDVAAQTAALEASMPALKPP
ncbi:MAG: hypothetical protein FJX72_11460, partial [Armatimonadetes bacterium]|nr:hypothetical protein [Armatimonadota bacterium]